MKLRKEYKVWGIYSSLANVYWHIKINQKWFGRLKSFVLINTILLSPIWKVRQDTSMTTVHQKCWEERKASITKQEKLGVTGMTLTITLFSTVRDWQEFTKSSAYYHMSCLASSSSSWPSSMGWYEEPACSQWEHVQTDMMYSKASCQGANVFSLLRIPELKCCNAFPWRLCLLCQKWASAPKTTEYACNPHSETPLFLNEQMSVKFPWYPENTPDSSETLPLP